jgi:hypothetical protein
MENTEDWSKPQNEMFKNVFGAIQNKGNFVYKSDALAMLRLNDENFIDLFKATTEITGDAEDIDLCMQRAKHLNII